MPRAEAQESTAPPAGPIVKWAGGKRSLQQQLLDLAPAEFSTYFEPFLGGASFFFSLASTRTIRRAVLSDINCELMHLYEVVRDDPATLMAELDRLQAHVLDEEFYYRLRDLEAEGCSPVERAARFIFLNKTCYNGLYRVNRRGHFNVPFGRYSSPPGLYNRGNMDGVSRLLGTAELHCQDFTAALAEAGAGDFVYLDPPYAPLTQKTSFTRYTKHDFGAVDQRRLAQMVHLLSERGCRVLLSNSETSLIRELYPSPRYQIEVVYAPRHINSDGSRRHKVPELAIRNYDDTRAAARERSATADVEPTAR